VHREYAACTGEIFRAAGNGVDALAFDRLARLGVVLDPEQVVEAQFASLEMAAVYLRVGGFPYRVSCRLSGFQDLLERVEVGCH
jgi:hypothetical protein